VIQGENVEFTSGLDSRHTAANFKIPLPHLRNIHMDKSKNMKAASTLSVLFLSAAICASASTNLLAQSPAEDFKCWGAYSNIIQSQESGDLSGLQLYILSSRFFSPSIELG
jgi:hypothetical protein